MHVHGVRSPPSVRALSEKATLSTITGPSATRAAELGAAVDTPGHEVVDGPQTLKVQPITAGSMTGALALSPYVRTPGVTRRANLTFNVRGGLESPFSILLELPDEGRPALAHKGPFHSSGWRMPEKLAVTFHDPPAVRGCATASAACTRPTA